MRVYIVFEPIPKSFNFIKENNMYELYDKKITKTWLADREEFLLNIKKHF